MNILGVPPGIYLPIFHVSFTRFAKNLKDTQFAVWCTPSDDIRDEESSLERGVVSFQMTEKSPFETPKPFQDWSITKPSLFSFTGYTSSTRAKLSARSLQESDWTILTADVSSSRLLVVPEVVHVGPSGPWRPRRYQLRHATVCARIWNSSTTEKMGFKVGGFELLRVADVSRLHSILQNSDVASRSFRAKQSWNKLRSVIAGGDLTKRSQLVTPPPLTFGSRRPSWGATSSSDDPDDAKRAPKRYALEVPDRTETTKYVREIRASGSATKEGKSRSRSRSLGRRSMSADYGVLDQPAGFRSTLSTFVDAISLTNY
ncbi:hypothetical protein HDU93_006926 [Gonapodya sp. JEL0774]|nr:hypothetical protein HDU93_006926 [Gonapodya sp. JEL0774]